MKHHTKQHCEFVRQQAKSRFEKVRSTWCDLLRWSMPYKATWILSQTEGERKNQHIVDPTHVLAHRSFVAGFLEGNTSASRPWFRAGVRDGSINDAERKWLQHFTDRTLSSFSVSNFYDAAGMFYYDYGAVNTGAHYFEIRENRTVHVHTLIPGSYFVLNNAYGEAVILVREFSMNVKSIVDTYGKRDKNGVPDWSNFSNTVKKMYEDGNYAHQIDIVHCVMENKDFDKSQPHAVGNGKWLELTYETGSSSARNHTENQDYASLESLKDDVFLRRITVKRKPFVVGKSTLEFEYGEKGPTLDALGLIKSLNKKAISKDQAIEQILKPALQGPSRLRKSYISHAPNTFVPIDPRSVSSGQKLEPIFQVNPAIGALTQDVADMRQQVDKLYYADFLLFLTKNPKTRTATETDAILEEQQRVIGPNLQSLNRTYNLPVVEWMMDYTLFEDPYLEPPPESLEGRSIQPEFVSVFAQAQKSADLPAIERYTSAIYNIGQIDPRILDKINVDKLADLYEDRLYLPSGLNNPQSKVEAMREQAELEAKRNRALEQTVPAISKAAKDASSAGLLNEQTP